MTIDDRLRALTEHMSTQLRVRGDGFQETAKAAGRKIPRRLQRDVAEIAEAEAMGKNPKLLRHLNLHQFDRAERRLRAFLDQQDPVAERRGEILDMIAKIAFVIVVVVLAVFFYLISIGYFE